MSVVTDSVRGAGHTPPQPASAGTKPEPCTGGSTASATAAPYADDREPLPSCRLAVCATRTTSAQSLSCASRCSRTATRRGGAGDRSTITRPKAPVRSSTSAHHHAFSSLLGRMTQKGPRAARWAAACGASERSASTIATPSSATSVVAARARRSVVPPLPNGALSAVICPRGTPEGSAASSAGMPNARPRREPGTSRWSRSGRENWRCGPPPAVAAGVRATSPRAAVGNLSPVGVGRATGCARAGAPIGQGRQECRTGDGSAHEPLRSRSMSEIPSPAAVAPPAARARRRTGP